MLAIGHSSLWSNDRDMSAISEGSLELELNQDDTLPPGTSSGTLKIDFEKEKHKISDSNPSNPSNPSNLVTGTLGIDFKKENIKISP